MDYLYANIILNVEWIARLVISFFDSTMACSKQWEKNNDKEPTNNNNPYCTIHLVILFGRTKKWIDDENYCVRAIKHGYQGLSKKNLVIAG